jgi:hypothetical protein
MDAVRIAFAVPYDAKLIARLKTTLASSNDARVAVDRTAAVLTFECVTWEPILRSRVMEAFEDALGPDWQRLCRRSSNSGPPGRAEGACCDRRRPS